MANVKLLSLIFGIIAVGLLIFILHADGSGSAEDVDDFAETRGLSSRASTYVGSQACQGAGCHNVTYDMWNDTTHPRKLINRTDAEAAGMPTPEGLTWDDISYVIGYKWKIRYVNTSGYIITYNGTGPGNNMYNLATGTWDDYHPGEVKQYDCGKCHTTGYDPSGNQSGMPGIVGTWNETGIGCEACHGPGSEHAADPDNVDQPIDSSAEMCGNCHQRAVNGNITEVNPDRKHHEQYNDWYTSLHQENDVDCINCHNPHMTSDSQYNQTNFMNYNTTLYSNIMPAKVMYYNGTDDDWNTSDYLVVGSSNELCGKCHTDYDTNLGHGNGTVEASCVDCHMSLSRKTINKWDIRSHTFKVNDNVDYDPSADPETSNFPYFTCEQSPCHTTGLSHVSEWANSSHANTNHGYNANTYCSHCMSPFNFDEAATSDTNDPVSIDNWTGINCAVCHDLHNDPSSLSLFNGTGRDAPVTDPSDLCGSCHGGSDHHHIWDDWNASAHANTFHLGSDDNTYCAKCMSPFQSDPAATHDVNSPVAEADWNAIGCNVCHDQHSLELALFNGTGREAPVTDTSELCGGCHGHSQYAEWSESAHANSFHAGENDNTYCAKCMSPFQFDVAANHSVNDPVPEANWTGIGCIVCHDQHSLELALYNGTDREMSVDDPSDLCGKCHEGSRHPQYDHWSESAHANSYHPGSNNNTYCSKCMSPFQFDPDATRDTAKNISEDDWDGIGCTVCHNPHSLELAFYNGTEREDPVTDPSDLCGSCHGGSDHHHIWDDWNTSAHANSNHGYNANSYCAKCMSPLQFDPDVTRDTADPISAENWTGIGCSICHDQHSLELSLFNGTDREDPVTNPSDLCGACHGGSDHHHIWDDWNASSHGNTYDVDQGNTYCSKCHAPLNFEYWFDDAETIETGRTDNNKPVDEDDWLDIACIVCHEQHSLKLGVIVNGSFEEVEESEISEKLCGQCHSGSHGHHKQYNGWNGSAHSETWQGSNNNTYCAHCMSPYQGDPSATHDESEEVTEDEWESITCIVCHDPHTQALAFWNGTDREEEVTNPADLCGVCHQGDHHPQYPDWNSSKHAQTDKNYKSMNYTGIDCTVCHNKHTLELEFWDNVNEEYIDIGENPSELCSKCHNASGPIPGMKDIGTQWKGSAHYDTFKGYNDNTYCAHCMSPYEGDPTIESSSDGVPIGAENWTSVGCIVCHNQHTLENEFFNGTDYVEVADSNELCGSCHTMGEAALGDEPHHPQIEMRTGKGAIGVSDKSSMASVKCAKCHMLDGDHSLEPTAEACADCHAGLGLPPTTTADAQAKIDEWQNATSTMLEHTEANITKADLAKESAELAGTWTNEMNDTYYTALFNYHMVEADGSLGVHNHFYAADLLDDANDKLKEIIDAVEILPPITVTPAADSTNVPVSTLITVKFQKDINFTDLETNGYLTVSGGVTGTLSYDSTTLTVTFTPSSMLAYNTMYTVTLGKDVMYTDAAAVLTEDFTWSFTTEIEVIVDIVVPVGPILDEDGNPLEGAVVTITIDGTDYWETTGADGIANIKIPADKYTPGVYDVKVTKSGYEPETFKGTLDDNNTFTPPVEGYPKMVETEGDDGDSTMLILAIVAIIIIVIIVLVVMVLGKKKSEEEEPVGEEEEEGEEGEEAEEGEELECPGCGMTVPGGETVCPECGTEFEAIVEEEGEEGFEDEEGFEEGEEELEGEGEEAEEGEEGLEEDEEGFEEDEEALEGEEEDMLEEEEEISDLDDEEVLDEDAEEVLDEEEVI